MSAVSAKLKRNEIMWQDSILCLSPRGRNITVITISHCYRYFFEIKRDTVSSADTCAIAAIINCGFQNINLRLRYATTTQACSTETESSLRKKTLRQPSNKTTSPRHSFTLSFQQLKINRTNQSSSRLIQQASLALSA